jgi:hypothetical protein
MAKRFGAPRNSLDIMRMGAGGMADFLLKSDV